LAHSGEEPITIPLHKDALGPAMGSTNNRNAKKAYKAQMNPIRLIIAFLASASLASAAAEVYARWPESFFTPGKDLPTSLQVLAFLSVGDYPDALRNLFGEHRVLPYDSDPVGSYLTDCIEHGRVESFHLLLSRLVHRAGERDQDLTYLLKEALRYGRIEIARMIMAQDFLIQRGYRGTLWTPHEKGSPWPLGDLMQFITDYRDQVAAFAPRFLDFARVKSSEDVEALIQLAYHCAREGGPMHFDPNDALFNVVTCSTMNDVPMAQAVRHLLEAGADARSHNILAEMRSHHPDFFHAIELLENWIPEDIKDPGSS
jgi:hypothetical protein